jgi:hypothetical protein
LLPNGSGQFTKLFRNFGCAVRMVASAVITCLFVDLMINQTNGQLGIKATDCVHIATYYCCFSVRSGVAKLQR